MFMVISGAASTSLAVIGVGNQHLYGCLPCSPTCKHAGALPVVGFLVGLVDPSAQLMGP